MLWSNVPPLKEVMEYTPLLVVVGAVLPRQFVKRALPAGDLPL